MRRIISLVLMGLAGFLIATALLALVYVPGQVKKTPLDTDSYTRLTGQAAVLPTGDSSPIKALSHTVADGQNSDGEVVVFDTFTCLITDPNGDAPDCIGAPSGEVPEDEARLVQASSDRFATDRSTAEAVERVEGAEHEGLVNKFPFDVEQKTYPFWDGVLGETVDATFQGEEEIDGLNTYRFVTEVTDEPAEISNGIYGTYSQTKTMNIDPTTGSIIKQNQKERRVLRDGTPVLDIDLTFTDETVAANVEDAKANASKLNLVGNAPLVTGLLGLLALAIGLPLWLSGRREGRERDDLEHRDDLGRRDDESVNELFDTNDRDDVPTVRRSDLKDS